MILQPLVENAIVHGFKEKESGLIKIVARKVEENAEIVVWDNGRGIEEKILEDLKNFSFEDNKTTGIGLNNIAKRLSYFYGVERPLYIESNVEGGTKVIIKVPFITDYSKLPKNEVNTL